MLVGTQRSLRPDDPQMPNIAAWGHFGHSAGQLQDAEYVYSAASLLCLEYNSVQVMVRLSVWRFLRFMRAGEWQKGNPLRMLGLHKVAADVIR